MIRFRHRDNTAEAAGVAEPAAHAGVEEHRSPGLQAALAAHAARPGCRVLDLGPAVPANVAFVSAFASHLQIADLMNDVPASSSSEENSDAGESGDGSEQPAAEEPDAGREWDDWLASMGAPFDLVLVWDVLSRLDRQQTDHLVSRLRRATRPGSAMFLLIHEGQSLPSEPQVFEIRTHDRLAYRPVGSQTSPTPKIPPAEVARRLPGFRVDASFVLRHGVREYVAVRVECDEDHIS